MNFVFCFISVVFCVEHCFFIAQWSKYKDSNLICICKTIFCNFFVLRIADCHVVARSGFFKCEKFVLKYSYCI